MRGNYNTNRSCRKKNLNPGKITAPQLRSPTLWNAIYKTASGKLRSKTCLTTLQQSDGTFTFDTESTTKHMLDIFVPEDDETNDSAVHKQIGQQTKEPKGTEDDKTFSREEMASVIKKFNPRKAPGEDGLTSEILYMLSKAFHSF